MNARLAPVSLSKVKLGPNQMAEDAGRAGQGLQDSVLFAWRLAQGLELSSHSERRTVPLRKLSGTAWAQEKGSSHSAAEQPKTLFFCRPWTWFGIFLLQEQCP